MKEGFKYPPIQPKATRKIAASNEWLIKRAVINRAWHMWGVAAVSTFFLGLAILVGAGMIADSLDAYCPVDEGVIYRPA